MERLQKLLASAGIASRRKCEEYITSGRVSVNGERVTQLGSKAEATDDIRVDDKRVVIRPKIYIALHKPAGYECTAAETKRRTVFDLVRMPERLFYVGRLDYQTEGLLLLTNDGAFAQQMSHPRYEKEKVYLVTIKGRLSADDIISLDKGMKIKALHGEVDTGQSVNIWPVKVRVVSEGKYSTYEFSIHEGRKNIIRRVVAHLGKEVDRLRRVRIGGLSLGGLTPGKWRHLRLEEVALLLTETKDRPKATPVTTTMEAREFKREWNPVGSREQRRAKFTQKPRVDPETGRIEREPQFFGREHIRRPMDTQQEAFARRDERQSDRPPRDTERRPQRRVWTNPNHSTPARIRGERPQWKRKFGDDTGRDRRLGRTEERGRSFGRDERRYSGRRETFEQRKKPFKFEKKEAGASIDTSPPATPSNFGGDYAAWKEKHRSRPRKTRYSRRRRTA
ncbi:pseudouridine synthase [Candidatus Woesearchaeota archaeon]|nr:pseudouridine synthase [Candidatus Woesearchaeota archaeon]